MQATLLSSANFAVVDIMAMPAPLDAPLCDLSQGLLFQASNKTP